ncbi:MAG: hypothetical protein ACOYLF_15815 [Blastocatellia bacterium]|jgi:hypothetical protein
MEKSLLISAGLLLFGAAWLLWRYFRLQFRAFLVLLIILSAIAGYLYFRSIGSSYRNPAIGRHAYLIENGKYLGVVEGEGDDRTRGKVWVIRPPGRYPLIYSKTRVQLTTTRTDQ